MSKPQNISEQNKFQKNQKIINQPDLLDDIMDIEEEQQKKPQYGQPFQQNQFNNPFQQNNPIQQNNGTFQPNPQQQQQKQFNKMQQLPNQDMYFPQQQQQRPFNMQTQANTNYAAQMPPQSFMNQDFFQNNQSQPTYYSGFNQYPPPPQTIFQNQYQSSKPSSNQLTQNQQIKQQPSGKPQIPVQPGGLPRQSQNQQIQNNQQQFPNDFFGQSQQQQKPQQQQQKPQQQSNQQSSFPQPSKVNQQNQVFQNNASLQQQQQNLQQQYYQQSYYQQPSDVNQQSLNQAQNNARLQQQQQNPNSIQLNRSNQFVQPQRREQQTPIHTQPQNQFPKPIPPRNQQNAQIQQNFKPFTGFSSSEQNDKNLIPQNQNIFDYKPTQISQSAIIDIPKIQQTQQSHISNLQKLNQSQHFDFIPPPSQLINIFDNQQRQSNIQQDLKNQKQKNELKDYSNRDHSVSPEIEDQSKQLRQRSRSRSDKKRSVKEQDSTSRKLLQRKESEEQVKVRLEHLSNKINIQQQGFQIIQRTMKDIEGDSMNTSRYLLAKSFKWSSKIQSFSVTQKKGLKSNIQANQIQIMNSINKNSNQTISLVNSNSSTVSQKNSTNSSSSKSQESKIKSIYSSKFHDNQLSKIDENLKDDYDDNNDNNKLSQKVQSYETSEMDFQNTYQFNSVQKFAESVTLFKQKLYEHQQIDPNIDFEFEYHSNIDNGSFGQVDLYFFDQENYITKICIAEQNFQIFSSEDQSNNMQSINSNQSGTQNTDLFGKNSLASLSTQQFDSKIHSNQLEKEVSGYFSSHENVKQVSNDNPKLLFSQIEQKQQIKDSLSINYLPAAGKKIKNTDEFKRELYVMQKVNCEYMPTLIGKDLEKQVLFMELGLYSVKRKYNLSDEFIYSILINVICAIESLLNHVDKQTNEPLPLFHSDIKPQNIILTVKKDQNQSNPYIQLLLIDYGGASFEVEDYWTHYTPAFVCNKLWEKLVNGQNNQQYLTWDEIRFAEVYAACRSIQFIIIEQNMQSLFKKENIKLFASKYIQQYPKTVNLLMRVFSKEKTSRICNSYIDILSTEEISQHKIINPQNIIIEAQKIFEISKLYNFFNQKQITNV